ncbi:hypothetical protein L6452_43904 [Arctium lappa]|uniref:Uncharacterized protein n=1 Tax=Arctium lappa TaxID=4217 RepID=A0ACB8XFF0_ARCLA|nr:hypothetical protein L6452_43904 [Arctium lappa]
MSGRKRGRIEGATIGGASEFGVGHHLLPLEFILQVGHPRATGDGGATVGGGSGGGGAMIGRLRPGGDPTSILFDFMSAANLPTTTHLFHLTKSFTNLFIQQLPDI